MLKACGCNHSVQLGVKSNNKNLSNNGPIVSPPCNLQFGVLTISSYSIYNIYSVIVTTTGELFGIGDNSSGSIINSLPKQKLTEFSRFYIKDSGGNTFYPISAVSCNFMTVYLISPSKTSSDRLLAISYLGINTEYPLFVNTDAKPVALYGGYMNAAAIDSEGSIIYIPFSIVKSTTPKFEVIHLPMNEKAVCVACCDDFIYAVGSSGRVFCSEVEIEKNCKHEFKLVKSLEKEKISEVSGTHNHCFAVSEDGKVFGCGDNSFGQLCFDEKTKKVTDFTEILSLNKYNIKSAYAGFSHSLFQTKEGKIHACGYNEYGQLFTSQPTKNFVYSAISTEIDRGATFCAVGSCLSVAFIDYDPQQSPNRRITQREPMKETENQKLKEENEQLKQENKKLLAKIKCLQNVLDISSNEIEIFNQSTINNMKQHDVIGHGMQSEVIKVARDVEFALKKLLLKKNSSEASDNFRRLFQEYEILHMLDHANIIRTFGIYFGDENNPPSILLEFCPHNLCEVVSQMNAIQRICAIFEISSAISAVHSMKIIHRDLKPENILIDKLGHVRVSDFGVSCIINVNDQTQSMTSGVGTLKFMAPELLNESMHYNEKVDVYSFGVVVFFILTGGQLPQISISEQSLGKKAEIPTSVNDTSRELINNCWSFEAKDRPSFTQIVDFIKTKEFKLIDGVENRIGEIKRFLSL